MDLQNNKSRPTIAEELEDLRAASLYRELKQYTGGQGALLEAADGGRLLNFSSNDYLGLASHPRLIEAAQNAVAKYGVGSGASRLVCGTFGSHTELEEEIASFKRSEAALIFATGYQTALSVLPALAGKEDVIILDKLCHACLIDGARLSGATLRIFPHNDTGRLGDHLRWAREKRAQARVLILAEGVYSMDGDRAPLAEIAKVKELFLPEALLLVDEAHAFGVIGPEGRGLAAELELEGRIDLQMGTFSKAAGVAGGYLCARREIIDLLINRARGFIFSTAPPPSQTETIREALRILQSGEGVRLRDQLWANVARLREMLSVPNPVQSAILPAMVGEEELALKISQQLREEGILVPAIRYPTVARGQARLRFTASAQHREEHMAALKAAWEGLEPVSSTPGFTRERRSG